MTRISSQAAIALACSGLPLLPLNQNGSTNQCANGNALRKSVSLPRLPRSLVGRRSTSSDRMGSGRGRVRGLGLGRWRPPSGRTDGRHAESRRRRRTKKRVSPSLRQPVLSTDWRVIEGEEWLIQVILITKTCSPSSGPSDVRGLGRLCLSLVAFFGMILTPNSKNGTVKDYN